MDPDEPSIPVGCDFREKNPQAAHIFAACGFFGAKIVSEPVLAFLRLAFSVTQAVEIPDCTHDLFYGRIGFEVEYGGNVLFREYKEGSDFFAVLEEDLDGGSVDEDVHGE